MSNRCNFCMLCDIKLTAAKADGVVEIRPKPTSFAADGVDIFVHYPSMQGIHTPTWAAWLMALPDHCVCEWGDR